MMTSCDCGACAALREEVGDEELWAMYVRKLLLRGWPGRTSPTERAFTRAHKRLSEKQRAHMRRLQVYRFKKRRQPAA